MQLKFLQKFNFNNYDLKTLEYLINNGNAAASVIAKQADIPTSKIYMCLRKLEESGLVRLENTSPKIYALVEDTQLLGALAEMQQRDSAEYNQHLQELSRDIAAIPRNRALSRPAASIAKDYEEYLTKHLPRLSEAKQNIYTYWQHDKTDSQFIDRTYLPMFFGRHGLQHLLLTNIAVSEEHPLRKQVEQRITEAAVGGNFHLWDGKYVLLTTGNQLSGIMGSVLYQDADMYNKILAGFMDEWYRAEAI